MPSATHGLPSPRVDLFAVNPPPLQSRPQSRPQSPPRVALVDDHPILLEGLARLLEPEFGACASYTSGEALLEALGGSMLDLVVLDFELADMTAIDVLQALDDAKVKPRVIVLTMHEDADYVERAMAAGASGFVVKRAASSELLTAVAEVMEGRSFVSSVVRGRSEGPRDEREEANEELVIRSLTPRQREIIKAVCAGEVAKRTASRLGVSRKTIQYHKYRVMRRLGYQTTAELIRFAVRRGLDA